MKQFIKTNKFAIAFTLCNVALIALYIHIVVSNLVFTCEFAIYNYALPIYIFISPLACVWMFKLDNRSEVK